MSEDRYDCVCKPDHIRLYGVVSYNLIERKARIHAIDRSKRIAQRHKKAIENEYRLKDIRSRVHIEEIESDHLFAESMGFLI